MLLYFHCPHYLFHLLSTEQTRHTYVQTTNQQDRIALDIAQKSQTCFVSTISDVILHKSTKKHIYSITITLLTAFCSSYAWNMLDVVAEAPCWLNSRLRFSFWGELLPYGVYLPSWPLTRLFACAVCRDLVILNN